MARKRMKNPDLEFAIYERDADLVARACTRSFNLANQQDWRGALECVARHIEALEASDITPTGRAGEKGQRYLHFAGPFSARVYARYLLAEGETLHLVLDDYPMLYEARGRALRRLGRYEEAVVALEKSLAWNPLSAESALQLIHAYREVGRRKEVIPLAIDALANSLTLQDAARFYGELALEAHHDDNHALAQSLVTLALALDPASQAAYDLAVYYEYETGRDRMSLIDPSDAVMLVEHAGLLLAPDQRFYNLAIELSAKSEDDGNFGRAAYYVRSAMALAPDEKLIGRMDSLYRKAIAAGQRTDGYDGFAGSGTFVTPASAGAPVPGVPGEYFDPAQAPAPVQAPDQPAEVLPAGHDHRSDPLSVRGNGEMPNAMGGMPGVAFPGQSLPYDGTQRGAQRHRHGGRG